MRVEQAFLGTVLKNNYLLHDSVLQPYQLERPQHQLLLKIMQESMNQGGSVDIAILTVKTDIEHLGGISYLNDLLALSNPEKLDDYETIIIDSWKEREKKNILAKAQEEDWTIEKINDTLEELTKSKIGELIDIQQVMVDMYESPWKEVQGHTGIHTGITDFDQMTDGFQNGELTIIAARPSVGKSDVMLHIAKRAGWSNCLPILFSLEMPVKQLGSRLAASTGKMNRRKLRNPYKDLSEEQKKYWGSVTGKVAETNIKISEESIQTVAEMRAKVRKVRHDNPYLKPIIIIDYLQLITPRNFYNGNTNAQVAEISQDLKRMARDFDCPVIALSQLSRAVEMRQNKRPMMSDIRDSGSVEQDADVIIFLYRENYYKQPSEQSPHEILEWIIAKNRNGPVGIVPTHYNKFTGEVRDADSSRTIS